MIAIKELFYAAGSYMHKHHKLPADELFAELKFKLDNNIPFVIGKIGGNELWAMRANEFGYAEQIDDVYSYLCNGAGFFSNLENKNENLSRFSEKMKDAISSVDYLNRWQYSKEEYFVKKYCSDKVSDIDWFGVVYKEKPIGQLLKNRKVLVVCPFDKTVRDQYEKRELIYSDEYLPAFELKTYKSVLTLAGNNDARYKDWFEALNSMIDDINSIDFDLALVGAGAYGLPICSAIKKSGKSAIHMGGDVQLLFGIMGKRWENSDFVNKVRNEYWVYPSKEDKPIKAESVENGCYW